MDSNIASAFEKTGKVATDTRKISGGEMFFALRGPSFNGNAFAAQALEAGAAFAVIDDPEYMDWDDDRYLRVDDCLQALQDLANDYRHSFSIPVFALTGTNGKTTTKELIHAILQTEKKVHATKGNLNNHIGVPLTLLSMPRDTEIAVIEMGANKSGDILELCEIAEPTHGLITNIGYAHLERFGSIDVVQETKGEIFRFLYRNSGTIWVNQSDARVIQAADGIKPAITYGNVISQYQFDLLHSATHIEMFVKAPGGEGFSVYSSLIGSHNAENILAAIAVCHHLGIQTENIQSAIRGYVPTNNRTQLVDQGSRQILLDAYNANPSSMQAAIRTVCEGSPDKKIGLVLGDMFELGTDSEKWHRELGEWTGQYTIACLVCVGKDMQHTFKAAPAENKHWFETTEEAQEKIAVLLDGMEYVLVKGSRGMALERLMKALD